MLEKLVVVRRKTRLERLLERYNTVQQARFYLEHAGLDFDDYAREDETYRRALDTLLSTVNALDALKLQVVDLSLVPTMLFTERDLIVAIGQDGLVANVAKYIGSQPLIGVNPDPARFDGTLLPFSPATARRAIEATLSATAHVSEVTLAETQLSDGQRLLAFNDFFVGARTHVSAQYRIRSPRSEAAERQSSSGVLIATGAGSTGWLSSVLEMTRAVCRFNGVEPPSLEPMHREEDRLFFVVREPFASKATATSITAGWLNPGEWLEVESCMPTNGVVFSDGVEADALEFCSGRVARIGVAKEKARLVYSFDGLPAKTLAA